VILSFGSLAQTLPESAQFYRELDKFAIWEASQASGAARARLEKFGFLGRLTCVDHGLREERCVPASSGVVREIVSDKASFLNLEGDMIVLRAKFTLREPELMNVKELIGNYFPSWGRVMVIPPVHEMYLNGTIKAIDRSGKGAAYVIFNDEKLGSREVVNSVTLVVTRKMEGE